MALPVLVVNSDHRVRMVVAQNASRLDPRRCIKRIEHDEVVASGDASKMRDDLFLGYESDGCVGNAFDVLPHSFVPTRLAVDRVDPACNSRVPQRRVAGADLENSRLPPDEPLEKSDCAPVKPRRSVLVDGSGRRARKERKATPRAGGARSDHCEIASGAPWLDRSVTKPTGRDSAHTNTIGQPIRCSRQAPENAATQRRLTLLASLCSSRGQRPLR